MDNVRRTRTIVTTVYVIALLLAVLLGNGTLVALVAVVGGVFLGAIYVLTRPAAAAGPSRSAARSARRAGRRR